MIYNYRCLKIGIQNMLGSDAPCVYSMGIRSDVLEDTVQIARVLDTPRECLGRT